MDKIHFKTRWSSYTACGLFTRCSSVPNARGHNLVACKNCLWALKAVIRKSIKHGKTTPTL